MGFPAELRTHILSLLLPDVDKIRDRTGCCLYPTKAIESATIPIRHELMQQAGATSRYKWSDDPRSDDQNRDLKLYHETQVYMPLRHDLERCWPRVLQCSRQIYNEGLPLMYQKKTFEVDITREKLVICSRNLVVESSSRSMRADIAQDLSLLRTWIGNISSLDVFLHCTPNGLSQSIEYNFSALAAFVQRFQCK